MHQRYYQLDDIKQVDHAEQKQASTPCDQCHRPRPPTVGRDV